MKVYIALFGLFLIAGDPHSLERVEILFLDSAGKTIGTQDEHGNYEKMTLGAHSLLLIPGTPPKSTQAADPRPQIRFDTAVEMRLLNEPTEGVQFKNSEGFIHLKDVLHRQDSPPLRLECSGAGALGSCRDKDSGQPLISARMVLRGGKIHPAEIFLNSVTLEDEHSPQQKDRWTFRPAPLPPDRLFTGDAQEELTPRPTFNGALLEIDIDDPEGEGAIGLSIGDTTLALSPEASDFCEELTGDEQPCIFLQISNFSTQTNDHVIEDVDHHFQMVYRLVDNVLETEQRIPKLVEPWTDPNLNGNEECVENDENEECEENEAPPGPRCIPPIVGLRY